MAMKFPADKAASNLNRRGFLSGIVKLGTGAAALTFLGCDAFAGGDGGAHRGRGGRPCGDKQAANAAKQTAPARPDQLFEPLTMGIVMDEKWRLDSIVRQPDSHLRVTLTDVTTSNPLQIEVFRGPDAAKRAIAQTDLWEFYTYDGSEAGKITPDHVLDAVNQLAMRLVDGEHRTALVKLNASVCVFEDRERGSMAAPQQGPQATGQQATEPQAAGQQGQQGQQQPQAERAAPGA